MQVKGVRRARDDDQLMVDLGLGEGRSHVLRLLDIHRRVGGAVQNKHGRIEGVTLVFRKVGHLLSGGCARDFAFTVLGEIHYAVHINDRRNLGRNRCLRVAPRASLVVGEADHERKVAASRTTRDGDLVRIHA